jgi:hypothetical protein
MKTPFVIGIGLLVLGAALMAGRVRAQPPASPGGGWRRARWALA